MAQSNPATPPAERQRTYRRRRALGARVYRIELPGDVVEALRARGVDPDDPAALGEVIEDAIFA